MKTAEFFYNFIVWNLCCMDSIILNIHSLQVIPSIYLEFMYLIFKDTSYPRIFAPQISQITADDFYHTATKSVWIDFFYLKHHTDCWSASKPSSTVEAIYETLQLLLSATPTLIICKHTYNNNYHKRFDNKKIVDYTSAHIWPTWNFSFCHDNCDDYHTMTA